MNYLLSGDYNPQKLELLIDSTGLRSEDIIAAVKDHLIRGASINDASSMNLVDPANLNRAIKKLNVAAERFELWNQLCNKSDRSKQVALVTDKKPARTKKPESWKAFFKAYPEGKKGGVQSHGGILYSRVQGAARRPRARAACRRMAISGWRTAMALPHGARCARRLLSAPCRAPPSRRPRRCVPPGPRPRCTGRHGGC